MLKTFAEVSQLITEGKLLHVSGTEELIKKLPQGNWIGGSTEYFMGEDGGKVTNELLFVDVLPYSEYKINTYGIDTISDITVEAYDNGFSIVIVPFDSAVHKIYAEKAAEFDGMFIKNIVGWVSGVNLDIPGQTPIAIDGRTGDILPDKAAVMHICVPDDKMVSLGIVNIFAQDENAPLIEFEEEGFAVTKCKVDGKEVVFADYIAQNGINTQLPLVGDYSGTGINISFKAIENGIVNFYAPVFSGIQYRLAKSIGTYPKEFHDHLQKFDGTQAVFSCNCILNFLYGELEGKNLGIFPGPITFGEIAYQLVNQTLVYVTVS